MRNSVSGTTVCSRALARCRPSARVSAPRSSSTGRISARRVQQNGRSEFGGAAGSVDLVRLRIDRGKVTGRDAVKWSLDDFVAKIGQLRLRVDQRQLHRPSGLSIYKPNRWSLIFRDGPFIPDSQRRMSQENGICSLPRRYVFVTFRVHLITAPSKSAHCPLRGAGNLLIILKENKKQGYFSQ